MTSECNLDLLNKNYPEITKKWFDGLNKDQLAAVLATETVIFYMTQNGLADLAVKLIESLSPEQRTLVIGCHLCSSLSGDIEALMDKGKSSDVLKWIDDTDPEERRMMLLNAPKFVAQLINDGHEDHLKAWAKYLPLRDKQDIIEKISRHNWADGSFLLEKRPQESAPAQP